MLANSTRKPILYQEKLLDRRIPPQANGVYNLQLGRELCIADSARAETVHYRMWQGVHHLHFSRTDRGVKTLVRMRF